MERFRIRTDLALEARESFEGSDTEVHGVEVEEEYDEKRDIRLTRVRILTERGAKEMGKPIGTYLTLEAPGMATPDEDYHREISEVLAKCLRELMGEEKERSILVAGLGNRDVTPDALGPEAVSNLLITRHLIREYGKQVMGTERVNQISGIVPGVMAQTGMETSEIIQGIVAQTEPDLLIAGGKKYPQAEPDDPTDGYRDSAGIRRGKSPQQPDQRESGDSGDCHRGSYGSGSGGDHI